MKKFNGLIYVLKELAPKSSSPTLIVAPLNSARLLAEAFPSAIIVDEHAPRDSSSVALVRAQGIHLPFASGAINSIIALDQLEYYAAAELIAAFTPTLGLGGKLIIAQRPSTIGPLYLWQKIRKQRLKPPSPEILTSLLLNCGFGEIQQRWPQNPGEWVVTSGTLKCR